MRAMAAPAEEAVQSAGAGRLVLVDVPGAVGVGGDERVGRVEEDAAVVEDEARLADRVGVFHGDRVGHVGGEPAHVPVVEHVEEGRDDSRFAPPSPGPGAGGVTGDAGQLAFPAACFGVVAVDLLVGFAARGVAVVVAGEAALGHEGEVAAAVGGGGAELGGARDGAAGADGAPVVPVFDREGRDEAGGVPCARREVLAQHIQIAELLRAMGEVGGAVARFGAVRRGVAEQAVGDEVERRAVFGEAGQGALHGGAF